ncbi:hypothetical protein M422DRAFT_45397 [Sphaerobolus stellatus SS14]|nr:hypothetical protein M422DRAFT_45397 [Sphaerobolus stellatus SS14]
MATPSRTSSWNNSTSQMPQEPSDTFSRLQNEAAANRAFSPALNAGQPPSHQPSEILSSMPGLVTPAQFADQLANSYELNTEQRAELLNIVELGNMKQTVHIVLFLTAHLFRIKKDLLLLQAPYASFTENLKIIKQLIQDDFHLTEYHKRLITIAARDLLFDPIRLHFDVAEEVMQRLQEKAAITEIEWIFQNPACKQVLEIGIKKLASDHRKALKEFLRDSVYGDHRRGLTVTTHEAAKKFKEGGPGANLGAEHAVRVAIYRRFFRENPKFANPESKKRKKSSDSQEHTISDIENIPEATVKTRMKKLQDFWGAVTCFLEEKEDTWGKDLRQGPWAT